MAWIPIINSLHPYLITLEPFRMRTMREPDSHLARLSLLDELGQKVISQLDVRPLFSPEQLFSFRLLSSFGLHITLFWLNEKHNASSAS